MASILNVDQIRNAAGTVSKIDVHSFSVAVIADVKAQTASGGTSAADDWQDRDLNTEIFDPDSIVSITSNQFTLGAGTYIIEFAAPAYKANRHVAQLYDVTNSTVVQSGSNAYANNSSNVWSESIGYARVSITGNTTYKIRHHTQTSSTTNGLGVNSGVVGVSSLFTQVKITKLA